MNFRDQHKQILMRLRVTNPTGDKSEAELRIWWEEHLDALKHVDPADLEAARPRLRDSHEWFPPIKDILTECRKAKERRATPTRAELIRQQTKELAPPKVVTTREDIERMEAELAKVPEGSVARGPLERVLKRRKEEVSGEG